MGNSEANAASAPRLEAPRAVQAATTSRPKRAFAGDKARALLIRCIGRSWLSAKQPGKTKAPVDGWSETMIRLRAAALPSTHMARDGLHRVEHPLTPFRVGEMDPPEFLQRLKNLPLRTPGHRNI